MTTETAARRRRGLRRLGCALPLLYVVLVIVSGRDVFDPLAPSHIDRTATGEAARPAVPRRVLVIIADGLSVDAAATADTPMLDWLAERALVAPEARTVEPSQTSSAIASLVSGRAPSVHDFNLPIYVPGKRYTAGGLFELCEEHALRCGFFTAKAKLAPIARDERGVERFERRHIDADVVAEAIRYLEERDPDLTIVHLAGVDRWGHLRGWSSPRQIAAVENLDRRVKRLLDAADAASDRPFAVVLVSDHGGVGRSHLEKRPENRRIVLMIAGDGVPRGAVPGAVSILDVAPSIATLLGIAPRPGMVGRSLLPEPAPDAASDSSESPPPSDSPARAEDPRPAP